MPYQFNNIPFDYEIDTRFSPVYNKCITQNTLIIPGGGCRIWRETRGRICVFCGFPFFSRLIVLGPEHDHVFDSWALKSAIYTGMYQQNINAVPDGDKLAIFNGGSFFENSELPDAFQTAVLTDFASRSNYQQLMVESRPEYLNEENLASAKSSLKSKDLMVGIGLETANDRVRNKLLRKAMSRSVFEHKVELMQKIGVQVFVYAFLGAPGLSEGDSRDDCLATIKYLVDLGVDEIALSCAFVPPDTPIEAWFNASLFRPPWLWTIMEIVEQAQKYKWPLSVGRFDDNPAPVARPFNCHDCSESFDVELEKYRQTGRAFEQFLPNCNCYSSWCEALRGTSS